MTKLHLGNYTQFIAKLNSLLRERGMSRTDLSRYLGCTPSLITQKMNGRTQFTLHDVLKLSDLFHISVDELLGREPIEARS
ncbi:helix-turn-helix transcriptional regulator [Bifidobacterium asteroides]|uniref:helix-turn-helix domain-containing protein n=1 Tax=Bifidobacterium asteroides TaxID=1684 RepID=UPI001C6A6299|nr:helix-turn-helix transcriptional regulator [Bifidobacterium asteroides]